MRESRRHRSAAAERRAGASSAEAYARVDKTVDEVDGEVDEVTVDASLVVLDFLIRNGDVPRDRPQFRELDALRYRGAIDPTVNRRA